MYDNHPIIIIDNDQDERSLVVEGFKTAGCSKEVIEFENGNVFLQFLNGIPKNEFPSMVMVDLDLPEMGGREILKEVKANPRFKHIPVIVYSASGSTEDRYTAFSQGANCFFIKPKKLEKISELLGSVVMLWCLQ